MQDSILFDLDGTLVDSAPAIIENLFKALKKHHYPLPEYKTVHSLIGPPMVDILQKLYPDMTLKEAMKVRDTYMQYYRSGGYKNTPIYKGIEYSLERLKKEFKLIILTNKPQFLAELIVYDTNNGVLEDYFRNEIYGDLFDGLNKAKRMKSLILDLGINPVAMVGDTEGDKKAAKENNVTFIPVTWGYGLKQGCNKPDKLYEYIKQKIK